MAHMNDERGCSTCKVVGTENYQRYTACNKKRYYQYDYRHSREPESWQEDWSLHGTQYTEDITNKINRYGMD